MFKITGLDHIVLVTYNKQAMLHFYCDILGCTIENKQPDHGLTQLRIGQHLIDLSEQEQDNNTGHEMARNLEHFCLRIQPFDVDALKQYFNKHNIEIHRLGERYGAQGQGVSFYIHDPQGNEVELVEDKQADSIR